MLALAGAEICKFYKVSADEYVFWLDVSMEDAFSMHEIDGSEDLEHVELDFLESEGILFVLEALVKVHVHEFEDEGELAWLGLEVPLGSSYSASIILMMFS